MIDFKKLIEDLHTKTGRCVVSNSSYAVVDGIKTCCITGYVEPTKIPYLINWLNRGKVLHFLDAVTGSESYSVEDLANSLLFHTTTTSFVICSGTPSKYDRLEIDANQVRQIVREALDTYK